MEHDELGAWWTQETTDPAERDRIRERLVRGYDSLVHFLARKFMNRGEPLEDIVQAQAELFRKYQGFADAVEPPRNATAFERALTLSGRDPSWKPAKPASPA